MKTENMKSILKSIYHFLVPIKIQHFRSILDGHRKTFGWRAGFGIAKTIAFNSGKDLHLNLPGSPSSLLVRKDTVDLQVFEDVFLNGELKQIEKLNQCELIIDCGAYTGITPIFLALKYPNALIYAIEAEESNFEVLVENTKDWPMIKPIFAGIWSSKTRLRVVNSDCDKWSFQFQETTQEAGVPTITIEDIIRDSGKSQVGILKMNIEGGEREVFLHSDSWLERVDNMLIFLHDRFLPGCSTSVYTAAEKFHFQFQRKGDTVFFYR